MLFNEVSALIDKWCPPGFEHERNEARLIRALMEANACAIDCQRVLDGQEPIRPLDSYPQDRG